MQEKNSTRAKIVLDGLRKHYRLRTYGQLAQFLDVKQNTLSSWIKRDSLDENLIYRKCIGLRYEWLETGEGDMLQQSVHHSSTGNTVATGEAEVTINSSISDIEMAWIVRARKKGDAYILDEIKRLIAEEKENGEL